MRADNYVGSVIKDIIQWVEDSLSLNLPVAIIAERSGYSLWHFQRIFKRATGISVGEYVRGRRLSQAAMALKMTDKKVLDIALEFGFDSQQTFTRSFKHRFHLPPGEYRKEADWDLSALCPPLLLDDGVLRHQTYP